MLQLQIRFPGGHYCAASLADPAQPEWPPHPSRVYSALVAAAYAGGRTPLPEERAVLQRLEAATPPLLGFPDHDAPPAPDVFVPVNDDKSRIEFNPKKGRTRGVLHPNRQVRQFPSVVLLGEPVVTLVWDLACSDAELALLDGIAARVTHVGTSHSLAVAGFGRAEHDFAPRWQPDPQGEQFLRVTSAGRLAELDRLADAARQPPKGSVPLRRPPPLCEVLRPYAVVRPAAVVQPARHDWISLKLLDATWGADTAHTLARALRRAVMSLLGDAAPAAVHGHDPAVEHLAWLPLPDVGHPHARGRIRGVAVGLPRSMTAADRALALAGLARLQHLVLPDGQVARLAAYLDDPDTPLVLRAATWCGPATHWSTVTPVLLDRPPKKHSPELIGRALMDSLVHAGFPAPQSLQVLAASDFTGAPAALDVPTRVPRFHARVVFAEPVEGPVLAGRWKNFGIGLFRPTPPECRS